MHNPVGFGGLVGLIFVLRVVMPVLAIAVVIDTLRRPDSKFEKGGRSGRKWFWIVPELLFLLVQLLGTAEGAFRSYLAGLMVFLLFVMPFHMLAYVLLVVLPFRGAKPPQGGDGEPQGAPGQTPADLP